ncbi:unnamed protein product, partial [Discosporangium mesarthrocarpum]
RKAVDTKWVFKCKINKFGEVTRYKGRLVAKGFRQIEGVDFRHTFALTPFPSVLFFCVADDYGHSCIWALGVSSLGWCGSWSGGKVAKFKSLYGCRQSSRNFCLPFVKVLQEFGLNAARHTLVFYVLFLLGKRVL